MPPLSLIFSKIMITLDLDESVTYRETDGRTEQQTDGRTDALIRMQQCIWKLYGQVPAHMCTGKRMYKAAHYADAIAEIGQLQMPIDAPRTRIWYLGVHEKFQPSSYRQSFCTFKFSTVDRIKTAYKFDLLNHGVVYKRSCFAPIACKVCMSPQNLNVLYV